MFFRRILLLFSGVLLMACSGNKRGHIIDFGSSDADTVFSDTLETNADTLLLDLETIDTPLPESVDELFNDFLFSFDQSNRLQRSRIQFPLRVIDARGDVRYLQQNEWQHHYLLLHQDFCTVLWNSRRQMELAQDSSELTVQFAGAVGSVLEGAGCMADAEAVYQKAAELSPDTPEFLHALCRIGTAGKDYAAAAENGKKALAACEKQYGENARMSIPVLADLALACFYGYDPDAASEYAGKALAIAEKQTRTTPESAAAYLAAGRLSMLMHKDAEAVSYLEQGQQAVAETCGEDSAQNAKALAWLGEACYCAAQYEKASSSYEKAFAYSEQNGAAPDTAAQLKERYEAAKKAAKGGSDIPPSY